MEVDITQDTEAADIIRRCFRCPHLAYKYNAGGVPTFKCNAAQWHCHYKMQKARLRELRLLD